MSPGAGRRRWQGCGGQRGETGASSWSSDAGGEGPSPQGRLGRGGGARLGVLTGRGASGFGPVSATPRAGPAPQVGGRAILDDGSQRLPCGSGCGLHLASIAPRGPRSMEAHARPEQPVMNDSGLIFT